jgi:hypothetical protein
MNCAAEAAAPKAQSTFIHSIKSIKLSEVQKMASRVALPVPTASGGKALPS